LQNLTNKKYKTLHLEKAKLYTLEIIYRIIASINLCFWAENEVFGRFILRNFTVFAQGLHLCQPRFWAENGD
jgi:hypothetical protein